MLRPSDLAEDEVLPTLVFSHGGAIGDDTEETPFPCQLPNIQGWLRRHLKGSSSVVVMAAARRWGVVMPRNDWCDAWQGLGRDDPIDPEHHFGYYHFSRVIDFTLAGGAGFQVDPDQLYAWGTSGGSISAVTTTYRYGGFKAVVWDSGISSFLSYWDLIGSDLGSSEAEMRHIFGGSPYDEDGQPGSYYEDYQRASPNWQLSEGGHPARVFVAWNNQDLNLEPQHGQEMVSAAEAGKSPGDWGSHDFDHAYPVETHHVQTLYGQVPLGYFPYAIFGFLEGGQLSFSEAEAGCSEPGDGCVGTVKEGEDSRGYSAGGIRQAEVGEVGVLYTGPLPEWVAPGELMTLAFAFDATLESPMEPGSIIGVLEYLEGEEVVASKNITTEHIVTGNDVTRTDWLRQYESTWLGVRPVAPGQGIFRFQTTGNAKIRLDAVIFLEQVE